MGIVVHVTPAHAHGLHLDPHVARAEGFGDVDVPKVEAELLFEDECFDHGVILPETTQFQRVLDAHIANHCLRKQRCTVTISPDPSSTKTAGSPRVPIQGSIRSTEFNFGANIVAAIRAFFAYPSGPYEIVDAVRGAKGTSAGS